MRLPKQVAPVKRPHFIQPYSGVDLVHGEGEHLVHIRMDLMHGANYNDPAPYIAPNYHQIKYSSGW